jgi:hypothetical protein
MNECELIQLDLACLHCLFHGIGSGLGCLNVIIYASLGEHLLFLILVKGYSSAYLRLPAADDNSR